MKKKRKEGVRITVGARVDGDVAKWLEEKKFYGEKSNVTSKALEFYYDYLFCRKWLLKKLIKENFQESKHLIRQIGRDIKKYGY